MKPKEIVVGARYRSDKETYEQRGACIERPEEAEYDSGGCIYPGCPGEYEPSTTHPMFREVMDIFTGQSGTWVAYRLPWGDTRVGRLAGFARWAKVSL